MVYPRGLVLLLLLAKSLLLLIPPVHGDHCETLSYDCGSCLQYGCYYCPGDAMCHSSNQPDNTDYTDDLPFTKFTTCPTPEDYLYRPAGHSCESAPPGAIFSDPEYAGQSWVYDMINVVPVWTQGITGTGVRVRVNDVGVDPVFVANLQDRFDEDNSCVNNVAKRNDTRDYDHGTHVAAILGAGANDNECSVGIAPTVSLSFCDFQVEDDLLEPKTYTYDISQNSYGSTACDDDPNGDCDYEVLSLSQRKAFSDGIMQGRQGKGIIYVFASGNDFAQGEERSFEAYGNTRFVISVGAVGKDRLHASYSTPGASVFIAGPGGDWDSVSNHITTGFDGTCSDAGVGTSFACPVVSGVIALVLEVNPDLTWRDVQYILAQTSERVHDSEDMTVFQNAAGYWHSHLYGFGIVNAEEAVTAARDWENVGEEQTVRAESELLNAPIIDSESSILKSSIFVEAPANFAVESVELLLDISSFSRGDLRITLTSPQGTPSVLHAGRRPENSPMDVSWNLLTVRHWGEDPNGEWTLTIVDLVQGDVDRCQSQNWMMYDPHGQWYHDCESLEVQGFCVDGQLGSMTSAQYNILNSHQVNGLSAVEACCACGGGLNTNEVVDELKQWTLVVYGTDGTAGSSSSVLSDGSSSTMMGFAVALVFLGSLVFVLHRAVRRGQLCGTVEQYSTTTS